METGFKKLWSRKKSVGAADQPARPRKTSLSNGNSTQSPSANPSVRNGRPSMTSIRQQLDRPFSQDRKDRSQDPMAVNNGEEFHRTKSGHRIQPMLVGISRPETAQDRPDTAGSLQTAVQKAADNVGRRPSDVSTIQPAQPVQPKSPQSYRAPSRHVDIFSVAGSVSSHTSRWNEEIAERNLEAYRKELENTPYVYNPSSKYQEEVATRNAYLPYQSRTSMDSLRRSNDFERTDSTASRGARTMVSPQVANRQPQQSYNNTTSPDAKVLQEPASLHVRSLSQRSRDGVGLPSNPREALNESDNMMDAGLKIQTPYSPSRTLTANYNTREARMSTIAEGQPYEVRSSSLAKSPMPRDSGPSSNNAFDNYVVSAVDFAHRPANYGSNAYDEDYEIRPSADALLNLPSTQSTPYLGKRTIVLGNRTVMDLTTDDPEIFSETSSAFGYSQYSPVVEQAKSDAFRRVQPSQIHTEERRGSKGSAKVLDLTQTQDREQAEPEQATDVGAKPEIRIEPEPTPAVAEPPPTPTPDRRAAPTVQTTQPEKRIPSPSGFSPISTVAAWSPRTSAYVATTVEPPSMTARVIAALEASKAAANESQPPLTAKRDSGSPTVRERVATLENSAERGTSPSLSATENTSVAVPRKPSPPAQAILPVQADPPVETSPHIETSPPVEARPSAQVSPLVQASPAAQASPLPQESPAVSAKPSIQVTEPSQTSPPVQAAQEPESQPAAVDKAKLPTVSPTAKSPQAPAIHTSPESITAVDYVHPSSAFGVRTRDFAISPRKTSPPLSDKDITPKASSQSVVPKEIVEPKPKPKKTRPKANTPARANPKDTGFDEEAFARKRAEARAAMEKLQRSLSEDFLTLPDRSSIKGKERLVESQPITPLPGLTSPVDPKATTSNVGSSVPAQKADNERPPPSSFRTSREMQQRSSREMSQRSSREMSQRSSKEMQQRLSRETQQRSSLASTTRSLSTGSRGSRRAPAPSLLKNVEPAQNPIDQNILSPQLLQALQLSANPPKSPGEISLSSFPVPSSSRPPSQPDVPPGLHSHTNSFASVIKRRSSTKSQGSTASAFSIPLHMVPGRTSSVRDPVPEEIDPMWA